MGEATQNMNYLKHLKQEIKNLQREFEREDGEHRKSLNEAIIDLCKAVGEIEEKEWLLRHAEDIMNRLSNDLEIEAPDTYHQNDTILKADKWSKYYHEEPNDDGPDTDIEKDINNL